ncbi:MAG: tetratricopeptide repeat protein [Deltaproteobacteria bacterium]|nr:tetratricopeptide repeat protein [Deltaproteobacteria bacterium]
MKRLTLLVLTAMLVSLLSLPLMAAEDAKTIVNRGLELCNAGKFDQAIQEFDMALKLKPNDAAIITYRGVAKYAKGQNDAALQDFEQAIKLDPKHGKAYYQRGMIYEKKENYEKAVADIKQAKSLGYGVETDWIKNLERKAAAKK